MIFDSQNTKQYSSIDSLILSIATAANQRILLLHSNRSKVTILILNYSLAILIVEESEI